MFQAISAVLGIFFWCLKRKKAKSHEDWTDDIKKINQAIAKGDDLTFQRLQAGYDRQIYGLKQGDEVQAVVCLAFTNEIPHTIRELDLMSKVGKYEKNADIAVAYTVWSNKKRVGAGREIMKEVVEYAKKQHFQRVVTLSPLTPLATHFHIKCGAKLISLNSETQNFEYIIRKN